MKPRLVLRLFDKPEAFFDGKALKWTALPRCYAVLAMLARKDGATWTRASLASSIWPDELDSEARANLRRHLHSLNAALPKVEGVEWIRNDDRSIAWNDAAPGWIDVRAFEEAAADPSRAGEALDAYRGELLESSYDDCVLAERERLRDIYLKLLASLISEARESRDFASAVRYAEKLLAVDEWREDAVRAWIASTCEGGDRSGALAAYERFARRLREEFSAEPMAETTALRDAIRAGLPLSQGAQSAVLAERVEPATRAWRLPFVGRDEAFEKLRAAWSRAARRSGSVAFVSGEAGIGKSRLTAELTALAAEQGGYVLLGRTSDPESESYQAFVTALRPALPAMVASGNVGDALLSAAAKVMPEIVHLLPSLAESDELPEHRARDRLFEAFVRLVEQASKLRPLCLVLEDLHWARAAALELLGALARRVGTLPILVVVTYRSEESSAGHPLRTLRSALVAERRAIALSLGRLTAADVAAVVRGVAGENVALAETIARLSEGNPLFVAQLLEAYHETGVAPDQSSALRTIGDAIDARVRTFDAAVRSVAEVAATLGESFRADSVADLGGWSEDEVFDALGALIDRGLIRESGGGSLEYVFTHALVAASFYNGASDEVRASRHRRAAQLLERAGGDDRARDARVARHWKLAGDVARASAAYGRAARAALDVYAREAAVEYAREALAHAADPRERFELLSLLVRAREGSERTSEWSRELDELAAAAEGLDDVARYESLRARERYHRQLGDREPQLRLIDGMLALAQQTASSRWRAEALSSLGSLSLATGRVAQAIAHLREGLELASAFGDRRLISALRRTLVQALSRSGDRASALAELAAQRSFVAGGASIEERIDLAWCDGQLGLELEDSGRVQRSGREVLELATAAGDLVMQAQGHFLIAWGASVQRDFPTLTEHYTEALGLYERVRQPQGMAATYINLGVADFESGFVERSIENFERAAKLAETAGTSPVSAGFALSNISDAYRLLGNLDGALEYALRASEIAVPIGDHRLLATTIGTLGDIRCARGEYEEGLPLIRDAIARWRSSDSHQSLVDELRRLIEAQLARGAAADVAELDAAASEIVTLFAERPHEYRSPARIFNALGKAARLRGDGDMAERYAQRARAAFEADLAGISGEERRDAFRSIAYNREFAEDAKAPARKGARRKR